MEPKMPDPWTTLDPILMWIAMLLEVENETAVDAPSRCVIASNWSRARVTRPATSSRHACCNTQRAVRLLPRVSRDHLVSSEIEIIESWAFTSRRLRSTAGVLGGGGVRDDTAGSHSESRYCG